MTDILISSKQNGNQYKVLCKIGEGAFAEVFKGQNTKTNEIVAIKKMKHMKRADVQMAKKEIELMKNLNHKNIVRFIDQFRHNGVWYIILEYCGKGDLDKYKQKVGKVPQYHCKVLVRGILEALVELHTERKEINKKKIAHRDLKLPNILINDQYQLKLADFGFSKDFEDGWMKSFCGTPLTMAPEVLKRDVYNEKCDVWSLGVITYYLLNNKYPYFPTKSDGPGLQGITNCVLKKPLVFDPNVQLSQTGKDFITQCLQKPLDRRPFSNELLKHPWFNIELDKYSKLRQEFIGQSFQDRPQKDVANRYKIMLFGVVEQHIKRIYETMLMSEQRLKQNTALFKRYYPNEDRILEYYLLVVTKKLEQLSKRQLIIILQNRSIKIQINKIQYFQECHKKIHKFIHQKLSDLDHKTQQQNVNIERQLIKFLLNESQVLMLSYNQQQLRDRLRILKDLTKAIINDFDNSKIDIKWGQRQDLSKLTKPIFDFSINLKDEDILGFINEQVQTDEDLQSIWLIQHTITENMKERKNGRMQIELGKQILYILNIPSNFTVERTLQSDKFELDFQDLQAY